MKNKKTVYIPIEWKNRELDSFILLSKFLIENNFRIIIGSKKSVFFLLKKKKKRSGIFFYKGGLDLENCKFVNKKCNSFVILDQEIGPITNDKLEYKVPTRFFKKTIKFIDRYYCIGKKVLKISKKVFHNKKKNISVLSGWPRIDLWKNQFNKFYGLEEKMIKNKYKKFIFFSSNFICLDLNEINQFKKKMKNWSEHKHPINQKINYFKNSYLEFLKFKEFLYKYEGSKENLPKLIIRPHPNEDLNIWKNELKKYKNIFLANEYDISPWINNCQILLHRGCTSSAHAQLRNKKTVFIKLLNKNILPRVNISKKISDYVVTRPEEIKTILNKKKTKSNFLQNNGYIYLSKNLSSQIIANDLSRINKIETDNFTKLDFFSISYFYLREIFFYFFSKENIFIKNNKIGKGIKKKYIFEKLKLLNTKNFVVKKIINNLILIESKN